jgi:MFS family permease
MSAAQTSTARSVAVALPIVIVAGCLISLLSFGPRSVMGLFLAPMTDARDWSREIFALSLAIQNIMWGIGQPFAGALADRYGSGRVLAGGGLLYAAGLLVMAWAPTPLWLNVSAWPLHHLRSCSQLSGVACRQRNAPLCSASERPPARWANSSSRPSARR